MMSGLKEYTVKINGIPHTMLLSEEDARARGLTEQSVKAAGGKAKAPAAKRK